MAELSNLIARGGGGKLGWGLVIAGVTEIFVSDARRSYLGADPFVRGGQHVPYVGLDGSEVTTEQATDWITGELDVAGVTLRVIDHGGVALRVLGGRTPSRRTYLAASLTSSATTVTVVSTVGWPSIGVLHVGREAIFYTGTTATTFTGCTRGWASSLATVHTVEDGRADLEVTDVPIDVVGRLAQLYVFVDNEASSAGNVLWRGIVESCPSTDDGLGFEVQLTHVVRLLDQQFGAKFQKFGIRGFYFSNDDPFVLEVIESGDDYDWQPAYTCRLSLRGFYPDKESLRDACSTALATGANWTDSSGSTGSLPVNDEYRCVLYDGSLAVTFHTDATTPRVARITRGHQIFWPREPPSDGGATWVLLDEDGTDQPLPVPADTMLYLKAFESPQFPRAYTQIQDVSARRHGVEAIDYPPNRIYHDGSVDGDLVTSFFAGETQMKVLSHDATDRFFEVSWGRRLMVGGRTAPGIIRADSALSLLDFPDAPIELVPMLDLGTKRWDELLAYLVSLTPSSGSAGDYPWLPSSEIDTSDITAQSRAAGCPAREWRFFKGSDLRKIFQPELQMWGLSWVVGYDGKLTVRRIEVTTGSTEAVAAVDQATDQATSVHSDRNRDGILNRAEVRGGYDARSGDWSRIDDGADMRSSREQYGERSLVIEPIGEDPPGSERAYAERDAERGAAIVYTHAYPYVHATLHRLHGLRFARLLLGDIVSITDKRVIFNGARGVEKQRGQVVSKVVRWAGQDAPSVDLVVRMSDWNAGAYGPCARTYHDTPLGLSGTRLRMRAENVYTDPPVDGSTRYDYQLFRVGNVVSVRVIDSTGTLTRETVTITRIDTASHYLYVDPPIVTDLNDTTYSTRSVVEPAGYDEVADINEDPAEPAQRLYVYLADAAHRLGAGNDEAQVYAA